MEKADIAPMFTRVYIGQRTQLEAIQTLTLSLVAIREALARLVPGFEEAYAREYEAQQSGELGQKIQKDLAAFDQVLGMMNSGNF